MAKDKFSVSISPMEAKKIIAKKSNSDNFNCEEYDLGEGKNIIVIILEKYCWKNSSKSGLVVICDNVASNNTMIKVTSTGSSDGKVFSFDCGEGESFINIIKDILHDYIIN